MQAANLTYPPMPEGADKAFIKPSASFRKEVYRSLAAIVFFIITYLSLFIVSVGIATAFAIGGIALCSSGVSIALILGAALIIAGLLLIFFVIKFLFKKNQTNYSDKVEITKEQQPELFDFIHRLTEETGSPKPKRIFLTTDVNAGMFYDSGFWSMFFPVKKNLQIGLGLVNAVNLSEFKAIMAHEFGHFSQRSMKFGSYVYNFNRVIYNMLYDNDSYGKLLNQVSRIHSAFTLMAHVNLWIIKGIQGVLREVYIVVNKTYLKLSREMEFHADATAAYASGSNNAISSLWRVEVGQACYDNLLNYWNLRLQDNKRAVNLYTQHREVMALFAENRRLQTDDAGLPVIGSVPDIAQQSDLVIKDQWSSHPSNEDREARLSEIGLVGETVTESAWVLFRNKEGIQVDFTNFAYATANTKPDIAFVDVDEFKADFAATINSSGYNEKYKGYYDGRNITPFDMDEAVTNAEDSKYNAVDDLLSEENCSIPKTIARLERDSAILDQIIEIRKDIKTFDYKGIKYKRAQAPEVQTLVDEEARQKQQQMQDLDRQIFMFFYKNAGDDTGRALLRSKYEKIFSCQAESDRDFDNYKDMVSAMSPVYNRMTPDQISSTLNQVYKLEKKIKPRLKELTTDTELQPYLNEARLNAIKYYIDARLVYYLEPNYDNKSIKEFNAAMDAYYSAVWDRLYEMKRELLDFQLLLY